MPHLQDFLPEQRELLVSLPYRAGQWVSLCDLEGGDEAAAAEAQVLESLITGFAEDCLKSEFVELLMKETMAGRMRWAEWSRNLESVPQDCRVALELLQNHLEKKEVHAFRQNIMEIAVSVALAWREDEGKDDDGVEALFSRVLDPFLSLMNKKPSVPSVGHSPNISRKERVVLEQLSAALRVDWDGNPLSDSEAA